MNRSGSAAMAREKKTIEVMVGMYCAGNHGTKTMLCPECAELLDYAMKRLDKCQFGAKKPACSKCTVHCYSPSMRERVRATMKYAGPRMVIKHPMLAIFHGIK